MTPALTRWMTVAAVLLLAGCRAQEREAVDNPPMARFVESLQRKDAAAFLSFFSTSAPWKYVSTVQHPFEESMVDAGQLKADFARKSGWYEILFDAGGEDCFRDWTTDSDASAWKPKSSGRFVRSQINGEDSVYVQWRRERGTWVIDVIAEPSS